MCRVCPERPDIGNGYIAPIPVRPPVEGCFHFPGSKAKADLSQTKTSAGRLRPARRILSNIQRPLASPFPPHLNLGVSVCHFGGASVPASRTGAPKRNDRGLPFEVGSSRCDD